MLMFVCMLISQLCCFFTTYSCYGTRFQAITPTNIKKHSAEQKPLFVHQEQLAVVVEGDCNQDAATTNFSAAAYFMPQIKRVDVACGAMALLIQRGTSFPTNQSSSNTCSLKNRFVT